MVSHKTTIILLACFVAVSYQAPRAPPAPPAPKAPSAPASSPLLTDIVNDEKAVEKEGVALVKGAESILPAPAKKIVDAEVAFGEGLGKDIRAEQKKIVGQEGKFGGDLAAVLQSIYDAIANGKISGPAAIAKAFRDIYALDSELATDAVNEQGKLTNAAKPVIAAGQEAGKSVQGLVRKEGGQAMKIGQEILKADEALAAGLAKEEGNLLTGNLDTTGIAKDEENFAKALEGTEQEALKDAEADTNAVIQG